MGEKSGKGGIKRYLSGCGWSGGGIAWSRAAGKGFEGKKRAILIGGGGKSRIVAGGMEVRRHEISRGF